MMCSSGPPSMLAEPSICRRYHSPRVSSSRLLGRRSRPRPGSGRRRSRRATRRCGRCWRRSCRAGRAGTTGPRAAGTPRSPWRPAGGLAQHRLELAAPRPSSSRRAEARRARGRRARCPTRRRREHEVVERLGEVDRVPGLLGVDPQHAVADVAVLAEDVGVRVVQRSCASASTARRARPSPTPRWWSGSPGRASSPTGRAGRCGRSPCSPGSWRWPASPCPPATPAAAGTSSRTARPPPPGPAGRRSPGGCTGRRPPRGWQ